MKDKIRLLFSGDFAPLVDQDRISDNHFNTLNALISNVDAHITNLECPLTKSENIIEKTGPSIKARPENVKLLKQAKVSIACLANNHIFDFGEKGITDTLNVCLENGIETIGIVNRPDGRSHWIIKEIKGKKIGFLNYCEHEFSVREEKLLGACGYNDIDAFYDIGKLKPKVDYLIVLYHGGNEYYRLPNPYMKKVFHYLADLGADAVIGHHTHVFSGFEIYNGKPLVYSLGNFFFPYPDEPDGWHFGLICELNIGSELKVAIHPIVQCKDKMETKLAEYPVREKVLRKMSQLSKLIRNDDSLKNNWYKFCDDKYIIYLKKFPCFSFPYRIALKLGIPIKYMLPEARLRSYENTLRCQSHFEIMKYALMTDNK